MHTSGGRPAGIKVRQSAKDSSANHEQGKQMQTSRGRPTGVKACQSAEDSSADHGYSSRDCTGAKDLRRMPHHQTPLVKNLESKGQDDDAQEAHQEVSGTIKAGALQHLEKCISFVACVLFVTCILFVA